MLESGRVASLARRALPNDVLVRIRQARLGDDLLDRHGTFEPLVHGSPDDTCAAATNPFDQAVMPCDHLAGFDGTTPKFSETTVTMRLPARFPARV
ncbi:hypothetical protein GCM10010198_68450 [Nocardia seriolae]